MAGNSMENDKKFDFNAIKCFPPLENGKINLHTFLEATSDLISVVDRLGNIFAPVKYDMQQNVNKIKNNYEYNEDSCLLDLMLDEYSKGKNIGAVGVLWLNRALLFFELVFDGILESLQSNESGVCMKKIFTQAYDGSVKKYHGWTTQKIFAFICKLSPSFNQILKSFEVEDDIEGFKARLASFNTTLNPVRCKIEDFFLAHDLNAFN